MSEGLKLHPVCRCEWMNSPAVLWRTANGGWWFGHASEDCEDCTRLSSNLSGWHPFKGNRYLKWVEFLPTATEEDKVLIQMARLVGTDPL